MKMKEKTDPVSNFNKLISVIGHLYIKFDLICMMNY